MSDFLSVRLHTAELGPLSALDWSVLHANGTIIESGTCLLEDLVAEVPAPDGTRRSIVIVPGDAVLLTQVEIPGKQQRMLKQVLPFTVEEQIIDPIETMHLATPAFHDSDTIHVAAVRRSVIGQWVDEFAEAGLYPDYLFADVLCVPPSAGHWQLLVDETRVLFRESQHSGMVLNQASAQSILSMVIGGHAERVEESSPGDDASEQDQVDIGLFTAATPDHERQRELLALIEQKLEARSQLEREALNEFDQRDGGAEEAAADVLSAPELRDRLAAIESAVPAAEVSQRLSNYLRSENFATREMNFTETASELLAVSAVQHVETTLNLLQGDFRPISANAENRRIMMRATTAVAACLGLFLTVTLLGGLYLNYRADSLRDESVAIYRDLFPKQRRVFDPVSQTKNQLSGQTVGGTVSEFLPLLDAASQSLSQLEAENPATIMQLRYDAQRGNITIDIRATNIDELEAYKDLLVAEGLSVDILSANQDEQSVSGRIQIGRS